MVILKRRANWWIRIALAFSFHQNFKTSLVDSISKLPPAPLDPDRFVKAGDSVTGKSMATIKKGIIETVNSTDPAKRAPAKGFISLTDAEVSGLRVQVAGDGHSGGGFNGYCCPQRRRRESTYVQANDRLPLCQPPTASFDCANAALNPATTPIPSTPPPTGPGPGATGIAVDDIPRYLARLIDSIQSPEQGLAAGLMSGSHARQRAGKHQVICLQPKPGRRAGLS